LDSYSILTKEEEFFAEWIKQQFRGAANYGTVNIRGPNGRYRPPAGMV
jgi:hypothetical protein